MKASTESEGELVFNFAEHVEAFSRATEAIGELAEAVGRPSQHIEGEPSEEAMVIQITAACKQAIRESGLSREQVLDRVNKLLGRSGSEESKRPISIHMFNNYLSKPRDFTIRYTIIKAIARITGSKRIVEAFVKDQSLIVIGADDQIELWLGKWEHHKEQGESAKRRLLSNPSGKGK